MISDYVHNQTGKVKIAVLSDFDGVITRVNVMNALYEEFGVSNWRYYTERWEAGGISTQEEIQSCLGESRVNKEEMEEFVKELPVDPSITRLYDLCEHEDIYFAIISEGFRWYIELLLGLQGIDHVPIFANEIHFHGDRLSFSYPHYDKETPLRGTSKSVIVKRIQDKGYVGIFLGDGHNDVKAAQVADYVLAKAYLLEHANDVGLSVMEFEDLEQATKRLQFLIEQRL